MPPRGAAVSVRRKANHTLHPNGRAREGRCGPEVITYHTRCQLEAGSGCRRRSWTASARTGTTRVSPARPRPNGNWRDDLWTQLRRRRLVVVTRGCSARATTCCDSACAAATRASVCSVAREFGELCRRRYLTRTRYGVRRLQRRPSY